MPVPVKLLTGSRQPRVPPNHEMQKIQVSYIPPQRKISSKYGMPEEPIFSPQRKSPANVEPPNVRFEVANVRFETSK